jgi:hypothetical protein
MREALALGLPPDQPGDDGAEALPGGFGFLGTNDSSVPLLAVDRPGLNLI